jgi:hypothetical protein
LSLTSASEIDELQEGSACVGDEPLLVQLLQRSYIDEVGGVPSVMAESLHYFDEKTDSGSGSVAG